MGFRYANFYRRETRWKVAIETWGMIALVTWVLWFTGGLSSPLLNAYLLAVITSALTLGKLATLVMVGLIASCYVLLGGGAATAQLLPAPVWGGVPGAPPHREGVNGRYGHEAGNRLLPRRARLILAELRGSALSAGCGPDEFIVLLPE